MNTKYRNGWVSTWFDVGRTWSKLGRAMGKVALENVAEGLKKTAQALDTPEAEHTEKLERHATENDRRDEPAVKATKDNS
jgi:hypothetical protein